MKKLYEMKTVKKDDHRLFTYEDGKKTPIPDDGVVYVYLSKAGMLKATDWPDIAGSVEGKFIVTDEIQEDKGSPVVNGNAYKIYGIGEDEAGKFVEISAEGAKHYISRGEKKVVSHPNQEERTAACKILYEFYSMLI